MSFKKTILAASLVAASLFGISHVAYAADSCEAQAKALSPTIAALTDATVKKKAGKLQEKAIDEATAEADEDECLDYLKDLKVLLDVK